MDSSAATDITSLVLIIFGGIVGFALLVSAGMLVDRRKKRGGE